MNGCREFNSRRGLDNEYVRLVKWYHGGPLTLCSPFKSEVGRVRFLGSSFQAIGGGRSQSDAGAAAVNPFAGIV